MSYPFIGYLKGIRGVQTPTVFMVDADSFADAWDWMETNRSDDEQSLKIDDFYTPDAPSDLDGLKVVATEAMAVFTSEEF